jgi:hypothetical protein
MSLFRVIPAFDVVDTEVLLIGLFGGLAWALMF